jgi:signal transduction histidine kinase
VEEELIRRRSTSGEVAWRDQRGAFQGAYWTIPMDGNFGAGRWVVSLHIPAEQAAAPVRDFRRLFGWVMLLSLLVSVLAASASIRRTLAPLDHLVDATRRLGDQDFAVELPAAGPAELRQLSAAFTTMAGRLRHQFTALEHERARLAGLVEHSPYGVLLIDAGGRIELTNELGRGYLQQLGIDPAAELHTLAGWSVDGLVERGDWQQISLAGASPREFVVAASGLADGASATSRVVVLRDVTEEQRLQRQLEQGERLAAVGRLAAGMAHDLNNILQGIGMCSQLLRPALSNDTARADLDAMQQLQDRAAALIRQVLDFTRQSESSPREVGLVPAVEEAVALLRRTLPADVHVESTAAASTDDVLVRIDPGRLQQVLTNLAVNARDAMPAGGSLRLAVDLATPPAGNAGEWVCLSVRDTGTGIPLELQGKVFDPFFTTKPVGRGTGLGLAQVYGIVVQHQGRVELSSTPGAGTEVRILLPVLRRAGAPGHGDATGNGTRENGTKGNGKSEEGTTGVSATLGGRSPSP